MVTTHLKLPFIISGILLSIGIFIFLFSSTSIFFGFIVTGTFLLVYSLLTEEMSLPKLNSCLYCGKKIVKDGIYCPNCGNKVR
jgi:DNA-directed RNA polymerase subunit RPC12/RpoP